MKTCILSFFFLFLFVESYAQDTSTRPATSPEDLAAIQQGEINNFKHQLYRYETALEDNDAESSEVIYLSMMELMEKDVDGTSHSKSELDEKKHKVYKGLKGEKKPKFAAATISFKEYLKLLEQELELIK